MWAIIVARNAPDGSPLRLRFGGQSLDGGSLRLAPGAFALLSAPTDGEAYRLEVSEESGDAAQQAFVLTRSQNRGLHFRAEAPGPFVLVGSSAAEVALGRSLGRALDLREDPDVLQVHVVRGNLAPRPSDDLSSPRSSSASSSLTSQPSEDLATSSSPESSP